MISDETTFDRHRAGETIVGLLNSVPSPLLCEVAGRAGYGFLILDMEHLPHDEGALAHAIRACELAGCEPWVRVPDADPKRIGRLLDAGAAAIVLPQVRGAAEVRDAVAATWFPPRGRRGVSGGRPTGFGRLALPDYVRRVNDRPMVVPMLETATGIEALPAILEQPGVAAVLEGALDLALDLNAGPCPTDARVVAALRHAAVLCRTAGIPFISNPRDDRQQAAWNRFGTRFFLAGEDRGLILDALSRRRRTLEDGAGQAEAEPATAPGRMAGAS